MSSAKLALDSKLRIYYHAMLRLGEFSPTTVANQVPINGHDPLKAATDAIRRFQLHHPGTLLPLFSNLDPKQGPVGEKVYRLNEAVQALMLDDLGT